MTHYILAAEPPSARLIHAIDAVRAPDGTELYERFEGGVAVSSERRPARPWAEPIALVDGRFAVPMPPGKAERISDGLPSSREVDVDEGGAAVRVRVPPLAERVELRDEDRATPQAREPAEHEREPRRDP